MTTADGGGSPAEGEKQTWWLFRQRTDGRGGGNGHFVCKTGLDSRTRLRGQRAIILRVKNYIIHARGERSAFGALGYSLGIYVHNLSARRKPHVHAFPQGTACNTVMSLNIEVAVVAPSPLFLRSENGPMFGEFSSKTPTVHHAFVSLSEKNIQDIHLSQCTGT